MATERRNLAAGPIDEFGREWKRRSPALIAAIKKNLARGWNPARAVDDAIRKTGFGAQMDVALADVLIAVAVKSGIEVSSELTFKKWILEKHFRGDKLTLSQKIAKKEWVKVIARELERQLSVGNSFVLMARSLTQDSLIKADVGKYAWNVVKSARTVAGGDVAALDAFAVTVRRARDNISRLSKNGAPTPYLQKAYKNLVDKAEMFNAKSIDKAIGRVVNAKARYNAERIARTEGARVYGMARVEEATTDPDVVGLQWMLSTRHYKYDICDFNANANLYGMGKGVYPVDQLPKYPAHPHCLCVLDDVIEAPDEQGLNGSAAQKELDGLPADKRRALLGARGAKQFEDNPGTWRDNLSGYEGPEALPPIPAEVGTI